MKSATDTNHSRRNLRRFAVTVPFRQDDERPATPLRRLKKALVEEFLPRYAYAAEVFYIGDTAKKFLVRDEMKLRELGIIEPSYSELPDIVAFSTKRRWLYLIEAVHSSGPVSPIRHLELRRLTARCKVGIVFLDRATFRKFAADISWETEVWIAENPDHLVHFNGDSFIGPHRTKKP